jgi:GNAT superfamily N-acetyltransferase
MEVRELREGETGLAYQAMAELRSDLESEADFVKQVDEVQRPEGYRLAGSFEPESEEAASVAGFRLAHSLAWGRHVYVDDLVTRESRRGRGHGDALMRWLVDEAVRLGCGQLHLDSGVQRFDAHRFYLAHGLVISAHHFAIEIRRD